MCIARLKRRQRRVSSLLVHELLCAACSKVLVFQQHSLDRKSAPFAVEKLSDICQRECDRLECIRPFHCSRSAFGVSCRYWLSPRLSFTLFVTALVSLEATQESEVELVRNPYSLRGFLQKSRGARDRPNKQRSVARAFPLSSQPRKR